MHWGYLGNLRALCEKVKPLWPFSAWSQTFWIPKTQSPEASRLKNITLTYRWLKPKCLHRVSLQVAYCCFPEFLAIIQSPHQKDFPVFVQACKTRGHKQAFWGEYWWQSQYFFTASWECKLRSMNVKGPHWVTCSFSLSFLFSSVPGRQPTGPRWSAELLISGSS